MLTNVDYAQGIVTASAEFKLQDNDKENHFYAPCLNADKAESYDLLSIASHHMLSSRPGHRLDRTNIIAGVDARRLSHRVC